MGHGLVLGLQMRCLLAPGCGAAAPRSLCCVCAGTARGHLKCEIQPSPPRMSATAQWHQQLGPLHPACSDLAGRRLPEAASAQELASGRLASRMHTGKLLPPGLRQRGALPVPAPRHSYTSARQQHCKHFGKLCHFTVVGW
jgi:hypothetical protein